MGGPAPGEFPHPLDRGELRRVRRQEQQREDPSVLAPQWRQQDGMVVPGIVQHDHHALPARAMPQQRLEERLEGPRIECRTDGANERARRHAHSPETGHRLASRRVDQHGVFDLGRDPHSCPRAVLLEMAFVQAPQVNVLAPCQPAQFF